MPYSITVQDINVPMVIECAAMNIEGRAVPQINAYPQPANHQLTLVFDGVVTNGSISVLDMAGRVVLREKVQEREVVIPTLQWPPGMYAVIMHDDEGGIVRSLISIAH